MAGRRVVRDRGSFWGGSGSDAPADSEPEGEGPWTYAPSTSHITRFRFTDAREVSLLKNFGHGATAEGGVRRSDGASELEVVFRNEKTGGEESRYVYWFADHAGGASIFEQMAASPHPHGHVLYPLVIEPKAIPYKRRRLPS